MIFRTLAATAFAMTAGAASAQSDDHDHDHDHDHAEEERRELSAHVHGEGVLNIAVDGGRVLIALEAPGADIVGFEHPAETEADKAAIAAAKETLADPLALFVMDASAGCAVEEASIELLGDEHHDEHDHDDHGHDDHAHEETAAEDHDDHGDEAAHSEFHAEYALTCADPGRIRSIDFAYFEAFPNAELLDVVIVTESGQSAYEVDHDNPRLALDGLS